MKKAKGLDPSRMDSATISEIVEMALSDHVRLEHIRNLRGLSPDQVKVTTKPSAGQAGASQY